MLSSILAPIALSQTSTTDKATAKDNPPQTPENKPLDPKLDPKSPDYLPWGSEPEVQEGYRDGLWREGKAVFSDVTALDYLMKINHPRYVRGYRPKQPIAFSHAIHLGPKGKMECQYCHTTVNKSAQATIPSIDNCMGCHKLVRTDSPEIKKLTEYFQKKEPVAWVPVNNLPEHAHFNHERHVKAGVSCHNCHGQMQKQHVVEKVSSLKMGFCVSCHRDNGASIDCAICHY